MGEPSEKDTEALRIRARERIEQGRLPRGKAVRTWGGLGSGLRCDLCDAPISSSEPEFELQLDLTSTESVRLHRYCHTIWNEVRESWQPGAWREVARELPSPGVAVEARVAMRETRVVIMNVICLSEPSGVTWINATTAAPLPEGWRPIGWRPRPDALPEPATRQGAGARTGASSARTAGTPTPSVPKRA